MSTGAESDEMVWPRRSLGKGGGTDMSKNHQFPTMEQSETTVIETIELERKHFLTCNYSPWAPTGRVVSETKTNLSLPRLEPHMKRLQPDVSLKMKLGRCPGRMARASWSKWFIAATRPQLSMFVHGSWNYILLNIFKHPKTWHPCVERKPPSHALWQAESRSSPSFCEWAKETQEIVSRDAVSLCFSRPRHCWGKTKEMCSWQNPRRFWHKSSRNSCLIRRCYLRPLPKQYSVSTVSIKLKIGWFLKTSVSNVESEVSVSSVQSSPKRNHWIEQHGTWRW